MSYQRGKLRKQVIKTVHKATSHPAKPPKEKHVKDLILRTGDKEADVEIIKALKVRMEKQNWAVVLKALVVFHRCFSAGDEEFIDSLKNISGEVFKLDGYRSIAPGNHPITIFITKYAKYLEEKVSVVRVLGYQFEKHRSILKDIELSDALKVVPKLQSQINALCNCKIRVNINNSLILRAYIMLINDSIILYTILHDSMVQLVDLFWKIEKKDASKILQIYKLYVKETNVLIGIYNSVRKITSKVPNLSKAEESMIDSMEKYIQNMEDEDGNKTSQDDPKNGTNSSEEEILPDELLATTPGNLMSSSFQIIDQNNNKDPNSSTTESSDDGGTEDVQPEDIMNTLLVDFPKQPISNLHNSNVNPFSNNLKTSSPYNTSSTEDKINFIKSLTVEPISFNSNFSTQSNPFSSNSNQNIDPFAPTVNPFSNIILPQQQISNNNSQQSNPFSSTPQRNNPFL